MSSKGEKIVVTGGAGFIGSHLVEHHLNKGDEVWVIDTLAGGREENLPISPGLRFDHADVASFPHLAEALLWADRVYHLAATLGMYRVLSDPITTLSNNIASCDCLLKEAVRTKSRARIMVASSSGVYAHTLLDPMMGYYEEQQLTFPPGKFRQESYYLSKMVNEFMAQAYTKDGGLFCVAVRFFNTVGPRQTGQYGMVIPRFVQQALEGKPLTVFGDGTQRRCFMNVHDAVQAVDLLLDQPKAAGEIVNVGHSEECSILELAHRVIAKVGSSSTIEFIPYEKAYGQDYQDVDRRIPNIDKLKQLTGFVAKTSLDETIEQVIHSFSPVSPRRASR